MEKRVENIYEIYGMPPNKLKSSSKHTHTHTYTHESSKTRRKRQKEIGINLQEPQRISKTECSKPIIVLIKLSKVKKPIWGATQKGDTFYCGRETS